MTEQRMTVTVNLVTTEPKRQDEAVATIRDGVQAIISTRDGFLANRILKSIDGRNVIHMTHWRDLDAVKGHHAANEQDDEFKRRMAALDAIASSAPNAYEIASATYGDSRPSWVSGADDPEIRAILDVEATLCRGVVGKKRDEAAAALADDFRATGHAGNYVDKGKYLDVHFSPERDFVRFDTSEQEVALLGDAAAVVCGRIEVLNRKASAHVPPARYTAVYARQGSGWRILAWAETSIDEEARF